MDGVVKADVSTDENAGISRTPTEEVSRSKSVPKVFEKQTVSSYWGIPGSYRTLHDLFIFF
jgi:hypothetical protein